VRQGWGSGTVEGGGVGVVGQQWSNGGWWIWELWDRGMVVEQHGG